MSKPTYKKGKKLPKRDRYSSSGRRIGAYFIDIVILLLTTQTIMIMLFWRIYILYWLVFHLILYFIGFLYFWLLETFTGQTLGKMICGIKTVDDETLKDVSMKVHLINCLLKCHWIPCLIDFIIGIIYNYGEPEKRLRILQNVSETVVIKKR